MNSSTRIPSFHLFFCADRSATDKIIKEKKIITLLFIACLVLFCFLFSIYFINISFVHLPPVAAIIIQVLFAFGFIYLKDGRYLSHILIIDRLFSCLF